MMLIPPLEQYSKDYTFLTPSISNPQTRQDYLFHSLMVIIDAEHTDGLRIDDNATSFSGVEWHPVPDPNNTHHLVRMPSRVLLYRNKNSLELNICYSICGKLVFLINGCFLAAFVLEKVIWPN